jgi:hypothetical protein
MLSFAEKYSLMVQDAVQVHHWSNGHVTLHPTEIYMHQSESPTKPRPISLCTASDCTEYVTRTFYAFQKVVILYIKTMDNNIKKFYQFRTTLELLQSDTSLPPVMKNILVMLLVPQQNSRYPQQVFKVLIISIYWHTKALQICIRKHSWNKIFLCESGRHHRN